MIRKTILSAVFATALAGSASASTIDLPSKGLQLLGDPIASSTAMSISDTASVDLGFAMIPGFFQALDATASPTLELNTGDGVSFNLSVTPGFTAASTETAREGDRQLEFLFGTGVFARFTLGDGDSLDDILTGATFSDASLTVWETETTTPVPLPAGLPLMLAALGVFAVAARRKKESRETRESW